MKKLIALLLVVFTLCLCFASCAKEDKSLEGAKDYLNLRMNEIVTTTSTPGDYEVDGKLIVNGVTYTVEWTVDVTEGVEVVVAEDGTVTIDVDENAEADIPYVLTATIKNEAGESIQATFSYTVPKFKEFTWQEFYDAEKDTPVTIKGVITGIVETSKENDLYIEDENGGYFVYNLAKLPSEMGLKIGMTVRVRGIRSTYSGIAQVSNASVEIIDSTVKEVVPTDITEAFKNAASLSADELFLKQSMFVTIKGATVLGQSSANDTYFEFALGGKVAYVRISSSTSMLTADDDKAFRQNVENNKGYGADVTGCVSVYNGNIYLVPVDKDAFSNFQVIERTPAEQVEFVKEYGISVTNKVTENTTIELTTSNALYTDVAITWALKEENACATLTDNKLTIVLPDEETTLTLVATITSGEASTTAEYAVTVAAASKYVADPITGAPAVGEEYYFALRHTTIGKTLYFNGLTSGNYYLGTTADPTKAVKVFLEAVEGEDGKYYLAYNDAGAKYYVSVAYSTDGAKVAVTAENIRPATKFTWDETIKSLTVVIDSEEAVSAKKDGTYYIGTYGTYETFSTSLTSYATNKGSFVAYFCNVINIDEVSDADKVAREQNDLTVDSEVKIDTEITLPTYGSTFSKVAITWAVADNAAATLNGNVLTVVRQAGATTVTLTATLTHGTVTETKEFTITVAALPSTVPVVVDAIEVGVAYKFALYQNNLGKLLFATGAMNGYYYATTEVVDDAIDVYFELVNGETDKYHLYYMNGDVKTYLNIVYSDDKAHVNVVYQTLADNANPSVYTWNADIGTVQTNIEATGDPVYKTFGTYNTYNTFSAQNPESTSSFFAQFYVMVDSSTVSDADKVAGEELTLNVETNYTEATTVTLPVVGSNYSDVLISWAVSENAYVTVNGDTLTITLPAENGDDVTVTLTATLTAGTATETKEFTLTIVAPKTTTTTIAEALQIAGTKEHDTYTDGKYLVAGVVTEIKNTTYGNLYIKDENGDTIYIYGIYDANGTNRFDAMTNQPKVGDYIVVLSVIGQYNGTAQLKNAWVQSIVSQTDIPTFNAVADTKEHDTFTEEMYLVSGEVTEIKNTTYGNMYIKDAAGNTLYIYGLYNTAGERFDAMTNKPKVGDTIVVYGVAGKYNTTLQMKNGTIVCLTPAPEVPEGGDNEDETEDDSETKANVSISFADKANRTELSETIQVWQQNGITVTNTKTDASSEIIDSSNPARFYKHSSLTIAYTGMTKLVINCSSSSYADALKASITESEGVTVTKDGNNIIIEFATAIDSFNIVLSGGQVRVNSIDVYYAAATPNTETGDTPNVNTEVKEA